MALEQIFHPFSKRPVQLLPIISIGIVTSSRRHAEG